MGGPLPNAGRSVRVAEVDRTAPPVGGFPSELYGAEPGRCGPVVRPRRGRRRRDAEPHLSGVRRSRSHLGFLDSMAYDGRPIGASMRHAKNFLLCYVELKAKRLGAAARLGGANKRAAWTFTVWGDPTLKMPKPVPPKDALPALKCEIVQNRIAMTLPEKRLPGRRKSPPTGPRCGRADGSVVWPFTLDEENARQLAPLAFAGDSIRKTLKDGHTPRLTSKVPGKNSGYSSGTRQGGFPVPSSSYRARRTIKEWSSACIGSQTQPADPCTDSYEMRLIDLG